ncbi:MAG TPA: ATP-grasp domain-containing protein [Rubrivivax sp.]
MRRSLALAGLSARSMAETAFHDGFDVVALDLFGDVDTCAVASRWFGIGAPSRLQIDEERVLSALAVLARQGEVVGWVAGSGFEGRPELLALGAALLPLIGTAPDAVARLRDPEQFFAFLTAHEIEHPPVRRAPADVDGSGWLLKDLRGSGGWHIRRAPLGESAALAPGHYLQREMTGQPMSATFVATDTGVRLLGVNQQIVRAFGSLPFVYCGVVGPVPVADHVQRHLDTILQTLAVGFALRGLASLDFLLDGERVLVLEVNPRPPASLELYAAWSPMAAHVRACLHGELPPRPVAAAPPATAVRGHEIVFARQTVRLDAAAARRLADRPEAHDLPSAGQQFAAGHPLCSIEACGRDAAEVLAQLHKRREAVLQSLERSS